MSMSGLLFASPTSHNPSSSQFSPPLLSVSRAILGQEITFDTPLDALLVNWLLGMLAAAPGGQEPVFLVAMQDLCGLPKMSQELVPQLFL